MFKGDETKYGEWMAKLLAFLRMSTPQAVDWIKWACTEKQTITEETISTQFEITEEEVTSFSERLYAILLSCTEDDPFRICYSVSDGNGLEAMRLLMKRYEPRTPGTKRALLKAIINNPPAKKPDETEKNLLAVENLIRKYEVMAGEPLPEDLRITVIIDLCPRDLREHLELSTKEMTYKEVRDEISNYVERKRDSFSTNLKAMEVDSAERWDTTNYAWWGGEGEERGHEGASGDGTWEDVQQITQKGYKGYRGYGSKGHGSKGYSGKPGYMHEKGGRTGAWEKGFGKNKGYGEKGKGKGYKDGFAGQCYWCGEWGHSQSRCPHKDEYMNEMRRQRGEKGGAKGGANNVEQEEDASCHDHGHALESLEHKRGVVMWRSLCSLESNPFFALTEDDEAQLEDAQQHMMQTQMEMQTLRVGRWRKKKADVDLIEVAELSTTADSDTEITFKELNAVGGSQEDGLWITVDYGASENVISELAAPEFVTKPSEGSKRRIKYIAANGSIMTNKGEKEVKVVTEEGHRCMLRMQVTDVKKPLMSVSRICDAGHKVVFTPAGGEIVHLKSGQTTKFHRIDNVYRLKVGLAKNADFAGPGR